MLAKWISKRFRRQASKGVAQNSLPGFNLKEVLDAHAAWKVKLDAELSGEAEDKIDVAFIASDCNCVLGKWLYDKGKVDFFKLSEYKKALDAHAEFHLVAAEVVIEHQLGNTAKASDLLATKFRTASNNNQLQLVRLFTAASK